MARFRRVQDVTHEIGADGAFTLAVTSADVRLTAVTGTRAQVRATFEVDAATESEADQALEAGKLVVEADAGRLHVSEADGQRGFGSVVNRLLGGQHVDLEEVDVTAPPGCRLELQVVSGDVQATGFRGPQRLRSVSGDLRLVDAGGELDIDAVSGDVSLRAAEAVSLKINNVSGDLSAEAPRFRSLRANAVSGDISVDGALDAGGSHHVDTVSGDLRLASSSGLTVSVRGLASDIHSSLPHRLEGTPDRRRLVVGDGAATVTFTSMSGDVAVTRSRQAAPPAAEPAPAPTDAGAPVASADPKLEILAALERGEIDVDEAMKRLGGG